MPYEIRYVPAAERGLRKLPRTILPEIFAAIEALAAEPRPHGFKQLHAITPPTCRVRVGDYRILYQVKDKELVVLIVKVADRKEAYSKRRNR